MSDASSHRGARAARSGSSSSTKPPRADGSGSSGPHASTDGDRTIISAHTPAPSLAFGRGAASLEAGSLLEGEHLGQFVLQKFIGGGGMGIVFRALDTTLNREVALKVLSRDQSADEEALRRFRNEAQSAARLDHDNIARVHYVGEDRGVHYIVFEFIEGVNIRDLVERDGPLPLDQAVSYTFQIAQALDHASQRSVIHRDIKPSNVLITPDGKAKLVDMGLARLHQVAQVDDLTASGVTLGTFDYISPEQARDPRIADVRSDMYSLGCSFFYMLTGRPPFPEGTVLQKLLQHQTDHPPDPRSFRPELPAQVARILSRLLAKNPEQRFQQPAELIAELSGLAEQLGVHLSSPRTVWSPPRAAEPARWRHHAPWMISLAALFLIVLILDRVESFDTSGVRPAVASGQRNQSAAAASQSIAPAGPNAKAKPLQQSNPSQLPRETKQSPPDEGNGVDASTAADRVAEPTDQAGEPAPAPARLQPLDAAGLTPASSSAAATAAPSGGGQIGPEPPGLAADLKISAEHETPEPPLGSPVARPAAREGLLVVSDVEQGPRIYSTLRAALGDAKSGDTIELRYNGRRFEKPRTIANIKLTLRAGAKFQPVIVFRPEPNPVEYPPSMLTIAGGQFTATGIHWELDLPRELLGEWALFEARRADMLRFERCSFTIRNASLDQTAYHAGVAFFDVKAAPGSSAMANPSAADDPLVSIDLEHCIARGEASLVRDNELQALKFNWDNGLLATSERLLVAAGGPSQPRQPGQVQINLRHVTAAVHGGLALLTNRQDAPFQLSTHFSCSDSILMTRANVALVEQRGSDEIDEYLERCQWSGEHDFFDGFDVFWQIVHASDQPESKQLQFAEWRDFWAGRLKSASHAPLAWRGLPAPTRAYHAHKPADYALDFSRPGNPAAGAAGDGTDAGCMASQLPPLPHDEREEAKPEVRSKSVSTGGDEDS